MPTTSLKDMTPDEMRRATSGCGGLPIEQSEAWQAFAASQGNKCWGRFGWYEGDKCVAVIALYEHRIRAWKYLWAKSGPVWIREVTPDREAAFRKDLVKVVRTRDSAVSFVRLHAWYSASDLCDVLQTITYDRTVVIDCAKGRRDAILESMPTNGRRAVRRAVKKCGESGVEIAEETGLSTDDFAEHYAVMCETAERDGFRPHPRYVYTDLLDKLGPDHARLFTARDCEGELLCWDLVLVNGKVSQAEYGASSARARSLGAPVLLDFETAAILGAEGIGGMDLRGAHSPRVPELFSVGKYKLSFAQRYTDIAGAWDLPIKRSQYSLMRRLMRIKRSMRGRDAGPSEQN